METLSLDQASKLVKLHPSTVVSAELDPQLFAAE